VASEALRLGPPVQTARTNPAGVERVPHVSANAAPNILPGGRPTTPRTPDPRAGGPGPYLLCFGLRPGQCRRETEDDPLNGHTDYYGRGSDAPCDRACFCMSTAAQLSPSSP
jgi:hypothetical protein